MPDSASFEQFVRRVIRSFRREYPPEPDARVRIDAPGHADHGLEGYVSTYQPRDDQRMVELDCERGETSGVARPFRLEFLEVIPDDAAYVSGEGATDESE